MTQSGNEFHPDFDIMTAAPGYAEYIKLIEAVARLETKIDMILDQHTAQDAEIKSIRTRVESLERTRAHSKGAMTVLSAIGGIIGAVVTMLIKNFLTPNP